MTPTLFGITADHPSLLWAGVISGLGLALIVAAWHYRARRWSTVLFGAGALLAALPVYRAVAVNRAITEQGVLAANAEGITDLCAKAARGKVPFPQPTWRLESTWLQWQEKPCRDGRCPTTHLHSVGRSAMATTPAPCSARPTWPGTARRCSTRPAATEASGLRRRLAPRSPGGPDLARLGEWHARKIASHLG